MHVYEILAIASAYLGLLITVARIITQNNKNISNRLESGSIKMTKIEKDIERMEKELSAKANRELVENQLRNIEEKLGEIKELIQHAIK